MTRQTANPTPKAGRNLPVAIGVGVGLFVPLTAGLIWAPWFFTLLIAVGLGLAAVEVHRALLLKGMRSEVVPIVIGTVVSVLGGYIAGRVDLHISAVGFAAICLAATMLAALTSRLFRGAEGFIRDVSASAFVIAYIPLMGVFVPLLLAADHGRLRILIVIACVVASDTGAFSTKENVLPLPNSLLSSITPPIIWIRRWLMAKPRPVPPNFRVVEASACVKSVNISA